MIPLTLAVLGLIVLLAFRELAHDKERQLLLDRIQAPQTVIAQRALGDEPAMPSAVHPESDEDYWDAVEEAKAR